MSTTVALLISACLVVTNGFFVGVELALVASRRTKLEALVERGAAGSKPALDAYQNITRSLFAAQLGITISSLILGLLAEAAVAHLIESALESVIELPDSVVHGIGFTVALMFVVFVHTVFGEMVPKNMAIARPETSARVLSPVHAVVVTAVGPVVWVLKQMARPMLRLAGVDPDTGLNRATTPAALVRMLDVSRQEGLVEAQEHQLITGALDFGDTRVRSVMIPLSKIVSASRHATVSDLEALVVAHGLSRIPIQQEGGRDFRGFVHAKDLVWLPEEATSDVVPVELIRRMPKVGIEQTIEDLLFVMQRSRKHMALVTAGGKVVGLATLEDVLEELVGEIYDETDQDRSVVTS